jgi:hypothetical protein
MTGMKAFVEKLSEKLSVLDILPETYSSCLY